ncbi:PLD-like domain-containing protein [Nocardioides exalbidus]|uniref:PLD-like domain-containing protein n=1 Tax=Nocardioides exalbidus TaxID=402596 RepID=A0A1H4UE68_9ACTN|nr:phospholipase D-like domain-containing protein [Nocardioides exalbidus]SEC67039.1 PLD-like domain-containing protein [Nocardioides exalbidus]
MIILVATALVAVTLAGAPAQAKPKGGTPEKYVPKSGPAFNNPYGKQDSVRRLIMQVNKTIDSVPRGGKIRISAWNVRSAAITNALIRAHQRKVSVQVVMDRANWNPNNPNQDAARLAAALKQGNKKRSKSDKSFLRRCIGSCRGKHGIPHSKFFLFNKVRVQRGGKKSPVKTVRWVTMYGSYNATELGATIQWNDLFTIKNDEPRYKNFLDVFNQMTKDTPIKNPVTGYDDGVIATGFYPYIGKGITGDPIMDVLNQVSCKGATTNASGTTRIRIAQTSMYGDRGLALANKIAQLKRQGCNIRLVYAMFGNEVLRIMRAAKVPLTHLAYDNNDDGLYDRYVHMKSMAISGNYAGDPGAKIVWNGSANWTSVAIASDEVVGIVRQKWVTNRYMQWIDYMFTHRPAAWGPEHPGNNASSPTGRVTAGSLDSLNTYEARVAATDAYDAMVEQRAKERGVDPYALIKEEN